MLSLVLKDTTALNNTRNFDI